jgi:hypothetical protein
MMILLMLMLMMMIDTVDDVACNVTKRHALNKYFLMNFYAQRNVHFMLIARFFYCFYTLITHLITHICLLLCFATYPF